MLTPYQKIAINSIESEGTFYLIRWWTEKYNLPNNHPLLLKKTWEELYIDYMIDHYSRFPDELKKDKEIMTGKAVVWKGQTSSDYEDKMKEYWENKPQVDLSEFIEKPAEKEEIEFDDNFEELK